MSESFFRMDHVECAAELRRRLAEPAPGRIQLIAGPRQVGKTTLLLELADELGERALYASGDEPGAASAGAWERTFADAEARATAHGSAVLFLDEVTSMEHSARRLKGSWDRIRRRKIQLHVVATGSSSLVLGQGAEESLAGRFERLVLHTASQSPKVLPALRVARLYGVCCVATLGNGRAFACAPRLASIRPAAQHISH